MYVWFYVLNHSKYRFLFHAVYIGIMTGIRKPTFHAARYNRLKYLGSDVRSRPLQSAPRVCFGARTVVILHRERPALGGRSGGFSKFLQKIFRRGFLFSPENSELYLCPTNWHLSDKGARSARPGALPSRGPFLSYLWIPTENRQTEMPGSLKLRVISTLSGLTRSKISVSTNCSAKPDLSITAVGLSSNASSPKSSSSSNATRQRRSLSPG